MLRILPAALLTLLALILVPAQAHAAKGMEMALQDDAVFLWEAGMDLEAALDHAEDLRTKRIRVNTIAPGQVYTPLVAVRASEAEAR